MKRTKFRTRKDRPIQDFNNALEAVLQDVIFHGRKAQKLVVASERLMSHLISALEYLNQEEDNGLSPTPANAPELGAHQQLLHLYNAASSQVNDLVACYDDTPILQAA
jgi:hypothetical protein